MYPTYLAFISCHRRENLNTVCIYSENLWHTCMLTCINANRFHPFTFMHGQTHTCRTDTMSKLHTNNDHTTADNDASVCQRCCLSIKCSSAAAGRIDSCYVPATCDSLFQHQHNDRNIINTPTIPPYTCCRLQEGCRLELSDVKIHFLKDNSDLPQIGSYFLVFMYSVL